MIDYMLAVTSITLAFTFLLLYYHLLLFMMIMSFCLVHYDFAYSSHRVCMLHVGPTIYYFYNHFTALWILSGTTRVSWYQKKHS